MYYLDTLRRTPALAHGKVERPSLTPPKSINPPNKVSKQTQVPSVSSFVLQPYNRESLQDLAQRQAMTEYKKQQALKRIKEVQRRADNTQAATSTSEKRRKLKELLMLYAQDKISPKEYYERRALIMGAEPAEQ